MWAEWRYAYRAMFDGLLAPAHLFVFFVLAVCFYGGVYLLKKIVRPSRRSNQQSIPDDTQQLADRWKENSNPFRGAP